MNNKGSVNFGERKHKREVGNNIEKGKKRLLYVFYFISSFVGYLKLNVLSTYACTRRAYVTPFSTCPLGQTSCLLWELRVNFFFAFLSGSFWLLSCTAHCL